MKLLTADSARKLTAENGKRRNSIIEQMNEEIEKQAGLGLKWASLPSGLNNHERVWLIDEMILMGFTIDQTQVKW